MYFGTSIHWNTMWLLKKECVTAVHTNMEDLNFNIKLKFKRGNKKDKRHIYRHVNYIKRCILNR